MGRFLNADAMASTGQEIIGNNMFAYCNNNPVNRRDSSGLKPEYTGDPAYQWIWDITWWFIEHTEEENEKIENGEVKYESKGSGNGAHIETSHHINLPWVMYAFISDNRENDIVGSSFGVMYEWYFHNAAYAIGTALEIDSIAGPAASLDVGKTIYEDTREVYTPKWVMSEFMKSSYGVIFPGVAVADYLLGVWWDITHE